MSQVSFTVQPLIDEAKQQTGLSDFADLRFRDGLAVLAETIDRAVTDENKRQTERNQLIAWLATRLKMREAFRLHPEIADEDVSSPVFVTGLPRSATSALFNLLNSDPDSRALLLWESIFPDPYYELKPGELDPRYTMMRDYMAANRDPEMDKIHYAHVDGPEECIFLQSHSFDGVLRGWEIGYEPYCSWFQDHDLDFLYSEHVDNLKLLQWQRPGKRWLLKAPAHMWGVPELLKYFPQAKIVWGHRDPVEVVPSIASLQATMEKRHVGPMSAARLKEFCEGVVRWYATSLERGLQARQAFPADCFVDYGFKEFVDNPKSVVQRIYEQLDIPMSPETEQALEQHILKNKKGQHGEHEYSLSDYGLQEDFVRDEFAFYLDHPMI